MAFPQTWAGSYRCCYHKTLSRQFLMKTLIFLTIIHHKVNLLAWSISTLASIQSVFNNSQLITALRAFLEAPQRTAWAHAGMQAKPTLPPEPGPLGLHLYCLDEVAWEKTSSIQAVQTYNSHKTYCAHAVRKRTVFVVVYWYFSR